MPGSDGGIEELGAAALGWRSVDVEQQLLVAVVHDLELRAGLDVDDVAWAGVDSLRRIAEVHRQRSRDRDERLFLVQVAVAPAFGARLVTPEVRPRVREAGGVRHGSRVAGRLVRFVGPRDPLELAAADDVEG